MYTVICSLETSRDYYIIESNTTHLSTIENTVRARVGWENGSIDVVAIFNGIHSPVYYDGYGQVNGD